MDVNAFPIIQAIQDAEITRLRAEVEALRADAERYRWLRDREGALWMYGDDADSIDKQISSDREEDAAIDAARAAQGGE